MKNKWNLLWNPFTRIAGWQAFIIGLVVVIATGVIGTYGNLVFNGAIDAHFSDMDISFCKSFLMLGIDLISVVLVMYIVGLTIAKGFRFVDILGTMTLSRAPLLLLAIMALFTHQPALSEVMKNPLIIFSYLSFIVFLILSLPVMVWFIALMYNALKISTGIKGSKLILGFILGIIMSEIISKILIHLIVK
ncbi:conserved membrane hypothetical protein [uncultured Paludibacter sp.]|nr:conserved membrane hypothetical protein [uncultured Paludibacter sp.]